MNEELARNRKEELKQQVLSQRTHKTEALERARREKMLAASDQRKLTGMLEHERWKTYEL